jgi:hypothetical protein
MSEFPKYRKAAYNRTLGLPIMEQKSADVNEQLVAVVMLKEDRAQPLADVIVAELERAAQATGTGGGDGK